MSIDKVVEKNEFRNILPKINWKEELNEIINKSKIKNLLYFNNPEIIIKRSSTNDNIINLNKSHRLNKKRANDEIEKTTFFNQINNRNETINNNIKNNIL